MKKFTVKASALAIAAVCGSAAFAGSISAPASALKYAAEAMTSATAVTLPNYVYTMGVGRPFGNGFTIIVTPSTGATFGATCVVPTFTGGAAPGITVKRQSANECAYDVQLNSTTNNNGINVADTFTWASQGLASHTLGTVGGSVSVSIALKDPGETSFVDNSSALTKAVATSVQSVSIYAASSDTRTIADVNASGGPLTGFVNDASAPAIVTSTTQMNLTFDNNNVGAKDAGGVNNFNFAATSGTASITLTGSTVGLKTGKFCIDLNGANACETGEVLTITSTGGTLSGIPATAFSATPGVATKTVSFQVDGTTPLGTSRTFALTGTITPQVGAVEALADTAGKNATAWVWSANASQLMVPYMSTNSKYVTRFSLLNTGTSAVGYSVQCYAEGSNVATNGANGTLKAAGTTIVDAASACSFSDATKPRGAVVFTINAPINSVKGAYNIVDAVTGANGFVPMVRPYNSSTSE